MSSMKKFLPLAMIIAFILLGLDAFYQSKPTEKNTRIYKVVRTYSPYYLEKRFGGLQIRNKQDPNFKEKPTNATLFQEFARLEKAWGKNHLKIEDHILIIQDDKGAKLSSLMSLYFFWIGI